MLDTVYIENMNDLLTAAAKACVTPVEGEFSTHTYENSTTKIVFDSAWCGNLKIYKKGWFGYKTLVIDAEPADFTAVRWFMAYMKCDDKVCDTLYDLLREMAEKEEAEKANEEMKQEMLAKKPRRRVNRHVGPKWKMWRCSHRRWY